MEIQKKVVWCGIILSLLVGFLIPCVSLAMDCGGGIPCDCVPAPGIPCPDGGEDEGNNVIDNSYPHPFIPDYSTGIRRGFVFTACSFQGNLLEACLNKNIEKAAADLIVFIGGGYLQNYVDEKYLILIASSYGTYEALKQIAAIEHRTAFMVQRQLRNDLQRLRGFDWPTEADKKRALIVIQNDENTLNKWWAEAIQQSKTGNNWSNDYDDSKNLGYVFHIGPAYKQLKTLSSLGWLKR